MRFHKRYCEVCKQDTLFLEKLTEPTKDDCTEMEDICQKCKNTFYVKDKL